MAPDDVPPHLDEHAVAIAAGTDAVWAAVLTGVGAAFGGRGAERYARLVRSDDVAASGPRPLAAGSTMAGFHVTVADPGRRLVLVGAHRFSSYALLFHLEPDGPDRTILRAESRAAFPGPLGGLYRLAVVGTRGHVVAVRRLLAGVRRRAEARPV